MLKLQIFNILKVVETLTISYPGRGRVPSPFYYVVTDSNRFTIYGAGANLCTILV